MNDDPVIIALREKINAARGKPPPKPGINAPVPGRPVDPTERWRELHVLSYQPIRDPYAVLAKVYAAPIGIAACGCAAHGASWLDQFPPPVHDRAAFERWVVDWRNDIARRKGRRTLTHEQARDAQPLATHSTPTGFGDAICGLYAVCGLAQASGRPVTYRAHSADWLNACVRFPGVTIEPISRGPLGPDMAGGPDEYDRRIATAESMTRDYADRLADAYGVPPFDPVRPEIIAPPVDTRRSVVLAPLCAKAIYGRHWPGEQWRELARELIARGHDVIAIGGHGDGERLQSIFSTVGGCRWQWGMKPEEVIRLMQGAALVVGNDSGPVHLAGLLGVPAVAVHAGSMSHDFLYPLAPSVRSVTPGFSVPRADHNRAAIESIPVVTVLDAVLEVIA